MTLMKLMTLIKSNIASEAVYTLKLLMKLIMLMRLMKLMKLSKVKKLFGEAVRKAVAEAIDEAAW